MGISLIINRYTMYKIKRKILYQISIAFVLRNKNIIKDVIIANSMRVEMIVKSILFSDRISTIPSIKVILVIHEPMILPKVRERYFLRTATIPTVNSGREVPRAIIVAPITDCSIPVESTIIVAESTMIFALIITIVIPMRKYTSGIR